MQGDVSSFKIIEIEVPKSAQRHWYPPHGKDGCSHCPSKCVLVCAHGNTEVQIVVKQISRQTSGAFQMATGIQNIMRFFVTSYNLNKHKREEVSMKNVVHCQQGLKYRA